MLGSEGTDESEGDFGLKLVRFVRTLHTWQVQYG